MACAIVLDGVISMAAALVAERLFPGVREYLIPSHLGKEPAGSETGRCFAAVSGDPRGNGTGRRNRSRYDVHTAGYGNEHLWTERYIFGDCSGTI